MRRILMCAAAMMLSACCALAHEAALRPELADPVDRMIQRLSVMSQRDAAFEGVRYNNGYLSARGCQLVSIANAVIACFGVENEQAAAGTVNEAAQLLVRKPGIEKIELTLLPMLLDVRTRANQAQAYPYLAEAIGRYKGQTGVLSEQITPQMLEEFCEGSDGAFVLCGRMTVYPDWTDMIELIEMLHEKGMDNAFVCLANVGAGREDGGTPLGLGKSGHYLTVLMHVGTFMELGRIYVLDSLPRAIEGEKSGYQDILRSVYPFAVEQKAFDRRFASSRIRETVIRLQIRDQAVWAAADMQEKAKQMKPLILYGPGVLMIAAE